MKKLLAVTLLTCIAACGQTAVKRKPVQTGWTKYEVKDEITDKISTGFYVYSLPPEKATLLILCRAEGLYLTIGPHFQVSYDSALDRSVIVSIRADDVASEFTGTVYGDHEDQVKVSGNQQAAILDATKVIKIKLFEFGRSYHVMTFTLQGPAPACPDGGAS